MTHHHQFYINGAWVDTVAPRLFDVINPATEAAYMLSYFAASTSALAAKSGGTG